MTQHWQIQDVVPIASFDTAGSFLLLGCNNGAIYYIGKWLSLQIVGYHGCFQMGLCYLPRFLHETNVTFMISRYAEVSTPHERQ